MCTLKRVISGPRDRTVYRVDWGHQETVVCLEWRNCCKKLSLWKDPHRIPEPDFSVLLHGSFGCRTDYGGAGREDHFGNDKAFSEFNS